MVWWWKTAGSKEDGGFPLPSSYWDAHQSTHRQADVFVGNPDFSLSLHWCIPIKWDFQKSSVEWVKRETAANPGFPQNKSCLLLTCLLHPNFCSTFTFQSLLCWVILEGSPNLYLKRVFQKVCTHPLHSPSPIRHVSTTSNLSKPPSSAESWEFAFLAAATICSPWLTSEQ